MPAAAIPRTGGRGLRLQHASTPRPQLLDLHFELLVAILKLLDGAGELTQCVFHPIEPDGKIARVGLRHPARRSRLR